MGWFFEGSSTMTRIQLSARQAWIRAYDRADDGSLLSGNITMYDLRILHAKRLLKVLQESEEWDINVTFTSHYYELNGRWEGGAKKQAMLNEIIERILREERSSNGSPNQGQPETATVRNS